jgi:hypothetical protein
MKPKDRERERCILLCLLLGLANNGEVEEEQVQPLGAFSHRNLLVGEFAQHSRGGTLQVLIHI